MARKRAVPAASRARASTGKKKSQCRGADRDGFGRGRGAEEPARDDGRDHGRRTKPATTARATAKPTARLPRAVSAPAAVSSRGQRHRHERVGPRAGEQW